jgi:nickel transport protein
LILALLAAALFPGSASAHRLEAEAIIRPHKVIQVESWFETGETPRSAKVAVYRADGGTLSEGRLDGKGIFVFWYSAIQPLRVVVDAGVGHRVEIPISAEQLRHYDVCTGVACLAGSPWLVASLIVPSDTAIPASGQEPLVHRETGMQVRNLIIGVGILLGVALASVQWRKMRQARRIQNEI